VSAELLREAAALMRERAEAVDTSDATGGREDDISFSWAEQIKFLIVDPDATHLSTFGHPAVALAVADWLDGEAEWLETTPRSKHGAVAPAIKVAVAYLGRTA
jgi:hypothetical protein